MMKQIIRGSIVSTIALAMSSTSVLAHVVVTPTEVGVAVRQDFSVGVPNEKDVPTTQVRLVLPEGLQSVTPYVKPGWTIETQKNGDGEEATVTEITWKGGSIGAGLRDAFVFRAMTPADPTTIVWKAYQTYADGTVVAWDQESEEDSHGSEERTSGPYSKTEVVSDLEKTDSGSSSETRFEQYTPWIAYGALLLSVVALALSLRGGNKQQ